MKELVEICTLHDRKLTIKVYGKEVFIMPPNVRTGTIDELKRLCEAVAKQAILQHSGEIIR